jgi:hypothetical protein
MSKSKIVAMATTAMVSMSSVAFAMEKVHGDPAHHGPGWLATFAAVCGTILAIFSVVAIYMMVSGKAGKYTE